MAEVLSVVAEHGIHGMEYNGLLETWQVSSGSRQSKRMRISAFPAPCFSGQEFERYMILAWRFGYISRSKYKEVDYMAGPNKSAYSIEPEIVRMTKEGWEFMEAHTKPLMHRWWSLIEESVPQIVLSIITAALTTWVILFLGAPK